MHFVAHQHKAAGRKTKLDIQNYGCNGNLHCYNGVVERNRISSLQSHGKALEKECCLLGVFCDSGDTPANLLCELNGQSHAMYQLFLWQMGRRCVYFPIWTICLSCSALYFIIITQLLYSVA